jgi:hypothetical protein
MLRVNQDAPGAVRHPAGSRDRETLAALVSQVRELEKKVALLLENPVQQHSGVALGEAIEARVNEALARAAEPGGLLYRNQGGRPRKS